MNMRWAWIFTMLSSLPLLLLPSRTLAQLSGMSAAGGANQAKLLAQGYGQGPGGMAGMMMAAPAGGAMMMPPPGYVGSGLPGGGYPVAPISQMTSGKMAGAPAPFPGGGPVNMSASPDAYGGYGAAPANFSEGMMDGSCPYCGGQGCESCACDDGSDCYGCLAPFLHDTLLGDVCGLFCPYPDGGCGAIRWFDVAIDYMNMQRQTDSAKLINFTSLGVAGPIVLSTDNLDFNDASSFRFTGAFQLGPGSNLEFTYYGLFDFHATANVANAADNLFSVFSQFGFVPPGGFQETDESDFQQLDYSSTFDTFEANFRQRWLSPNCRYQGSWLVGARHFILDERFRYFTSSSANGINGNPLIPAQLDAITRTTNSMTGIQVGGDVWICLMPGLRLGAEGKAGVFGNRMNANTSIAVNTGAAEFLEENTQDDVAFLTDASVTMTYRFSYSWTGRVAYNVLYASGVALAQDNFNTVPPFGPGPTRVPFIDTDGDAFFHGWSAGVEFLW